MYAFAAVPGWVLSHVEAGGVHAYVGVLDLVLFSHASVCSRPGW